MSEASRAREKAKLLGGGFSPPGSGKEDQHGAAPAPISPDPFLDYLDKSCPFTSSVWGGAVVVASQGMTMQGEQLVRGIEQKIVPQGGLGFAPCHRLCKLFLPDPGVGPKERAKGRCSLELLADFIPPVAAESAQGEPS